MFIDRVCLYLTLSNKETKEMKLAIMQPYFLPYIGYFQLLHLVDKFVVYDNIEFTKKSWINRNRILSYNGEQKFSIPIKKESDYLNIVDRHLSIDYIKYNQKTLRNISAVYQKALHFDKIFPILESIFLFKEQENLFEFILFSLKKIKMLLQINTDIIISSEVDIDHELKGRDKVLSICKAVGADHYINAIGGRELYNKEDFAKEGIKLNFISTLPIVYKQFKNEFIPSLSIADVLMFNSIDRIQLMLNEFELI